jgi:phenylacetate-CoA ligase
LRWLDTPESWSGLVDDWIEVYRAAEISRTDRIYFAFSFGPFLGFWLAFDAGTNIGCLCFPGGGLSSLARLRAILENGVTVICCTPTYALRLAEVAAENGLNLASSSVRTLIVAGEPGGSVAALRQQISERWNGARVCDHHGMTEVGPVSYECPATPRLLHVMDHSFLVESVNPQTGNPAAVGEVGELILTTLKRSASPLLRYRTGDLVQISAAGTCACGRSLTGLRGGILGRLDDMVVVRGVNVYPSAVDEIVRSIHEIAEYQVRLIERPSRVEMELEIEVTPDCDLSHPVAERLAGAMSSALSLRVPVRVAAPGSLPRFELKARRWQRVRMS